jgi:hypothetical protein
LSWSSIVGSIYDLEGTALHLRADLKGAKVCYERALALQPLPVGFEIALKLGSIHIEMGAYDEVPLPLLLLSWSYFPPFPLPLISLSSPFLSLPPLSSPFPLLPFLSFFLPFHSLSLSPPTLFLRGVYNVY